MELSAGWRAAVGDDDLRRRFTEPSFADDHWQSIDVPGHWGTAPAFSDTDGPLLYRTYFDHAEAGTYTRTWLTFDGLFYQGDVWLDGAYLGDTEGYFFPHTFEI